MGNLTDEQINNLIKVAGLSIADLPKTHKELHRMIWDAYEAGTKVSQVELPVMQKIASIKEQALKGLLTDGGHHKQWFLEAILGMLTTEKEWLYLKEKEQWQEGIAP